MSATMIRVRNIVIVRSVVFAGAVRVSYPYLRKEAAHRYAVSRGRDSERLPVRHRSVAESASISGERDLAPSAVINNLKGIRRSP